MLSSLPPDCHVYGVMKIDIISDVVCPWCLIGWRQLERALADTGITADVRWHPFELNPGMPVEGEDIAQHIARKYGATPDRMTETRARMDAIAAPLGVDLSGRAARIWNTRDAHRLLHWARDSGCQTALKLALFDAYFGRGENVSDHAVLLGAVERAGLDRGVAADILASGRYDAAVEALEERWREMDITGVPAFILAERGLVLGAQGEERLAAALRRMSAPSPAE